MGKVFEFKRKSPGIDVSRWDTSYDIAQELLDAKREMRLLKREIRMYQKCLDSHKALNNTKTSLIVSQRNVIEQQAVLLIFYGYRAN